MNIIIGIILATIISLLNFVIVDTFSGLPEMPVEQGANIVGHDIQERKGDLAGGFFQGNILCSPDASAGTLISSIAIMACGFQGGLIAALLVFIGNRLCSDPGYAGTTGSLTMTVLVFIFTTFLGMTPQMFICGAVIAILLVQGIYHKYSSRTLGKIAKIMNRYTNES